MTPDLNSVFYSRELTVQGSFLLMWHMLIIEGPGKHAKHTFSNTIIYITFLLLVITTAVSYNETRCSTAICFYIFLLFNNKRQKEKEKHPMYCALIVCQALD